MRNEIALAVEELLNASGLEGFIVPYENEESDRWTLWYVVPHSKSGKRAHRLVINVCQLRSQDELIAPMLAGEVCLEGTGRTLLDLGFEEPTVEGAQAMVSKLIEWVRKQDGV